MVDLQRAIVVGRSEQYNSEAVHVRCTLTRERRMDIPIVFVVEDDVFEFLPAVPRYVDIHAHHMQRVERAPT